MPAFAAPNRRPEGLSRGTVADIAASSSEPARIEGTITRTEKRSITGPKSSTMAMKLSEPHRRTRP